MSSFFYKNSDRRWTWMGPNGNRIHEIDFIIANKKSIVCNVTVLSQKYWPDHMMRDESIPEYILPNRKSKKGGIEETRRWQDPEGISNFEKKVAEALAITKTQEIKELDIKIIEALVKANKAHCPKLPNDIKSTHTQKH